MVFFKKPYTVRSYGVTSWANGSPTSSYTDRTVHLDVQGITRTNQDEQSGRMTTGSLTVYSDEELHPAEADKKYSGDRIFLTAGMCAGSPSGGSIRFWPIGSLSLKP